MRRSGSGGGVGADLRRLRCAICIRRPTVLLLQLTRLRARVSPAVKGDASGTVPSPRGHQHGEARRQTAHTRLLSAAERSRDRPGDGEKDPRRGRSPTASEPQELHSSPNLPAAPPPRRCNPAPRRPAAPRHGHRMPTKKERVEKEEERRGRQGKRASATDAPPDLNLNDR